MVESRPGAEDPHAIELMAKLASNSRKRWPTAELVDGAAMPGILPGANGDGIGAAAAAAATSPATEL